MSDIKREAEAEAERFFGKATKLMDRLLWPSYKLVWSLGYVHGATARSQGTRDESEPS